MNYSTGLECSKAIRESLKGIEIESERTVTEDGIFLRRTSVIGEYEYPSYSLSELAEVLKVLREGKGTRETIGGIYPIWILEYLELCEIWSTTQSKERCDEFLSNLIQN